MHIDYSTAYIHQLSVHLVGNTSQHDILKTSSKPVLLDSEMSDRLKDYFLKPFTKLTEKYHFTHVESLEYNEVYNFVGEALTEDIPFHDVSVKVARHLHNKSEHPQIKSGEMFFVHFSNIMVDNTPIEAIGIFKVEHTLGIFQIKQLLSNFDIDYQEGIDAGKLDKGALILDINFESGFEMLIHDKNSNKGDEALYWKEDFLNVEAVQDSYTHTRNFMNMAKDFIQYQVQKDVSDVGKTDQIDMLNKSLQFFKSTQDFDQSDFENTVFSQEEEKESFRTYSAAHRHDYGLELDSGFEISHPAVKKQAKIFKSVLKLDKNFHVYIHGDRSLIERGVDDNGKKYYKIYFNEEN